MAGQKSGRGLAASVGSNRVRSFGTVEARSAPNRGTRPRYFALTRVSTRRQAVEGLSLPEQMVQLEADHAALHPGHEFVQVELPGVSGGPKSDRHREALLAEIQDGDVLAAATLDRFGRSMLSV